MEDVRHEGATWERGPMTSIGGLTGPCGCYDCTVKLMPPSLSPEINGRVEGRVAAGERS